MWERLCCIFHNTSSTDATVQKGTKIWSKVCDIFLSVSNTDAVVQQVVYARFRKFCGIVIE